MLSESVVVGVDIGGTKIAVASSDRAGKLISEQTIQTNAHEPPEMVIARLSETIIQVINDTNHKVLGIGIAVPGAVSPDDGIARNAVNLGWKNVPLRNMVRSNLGDTSLPIFLQNDVNALALGELIFGAAQGIPDFVLLAVGTGLGGGAVVSGDILNGSTGSGMEIGHIVIHPHGRPCKCGRHGCAEQYVSGNGLLAAAVEHNLDTVDEDRLTTQYILSSARSGDAKALSIIHEAAEALGKVMAICAAVLNPSLIVIGGGLGNASYDLIALRAESVFRQLVMDDVHQPVRIVRSSLPSSALGSAALVWHGLHHISS